MDLTKFEFPKMGMDTNKELLEEAKARGFYCENTPYNKLFSNLFFRGGSIEFKKDVEEDFKNKAWAYCRSFMKSFMPKHEEKEAICAMLMSELLEPKLKEEKEVS